MFMLVVFPAPLGPTNAQIWPCESTNETSLRAWTSCPLSRLRYVLVTPRNSMTGAVTFFVPFLLFETGELDPQPSHQLELQRLIEALLRISHLSIFVDHKNCGNSIDGIRRCRDPFWIEEDRKRKLLCGCILRRLSSLFVEANCQYLEVRIF